MMAITLDGVTKRFGETPALGGVSWAVRPGEMFGVIGPDGAGKTTVVRVMAGLLHPDEGRVRVLDLDPVVDHGRLTGVVGYLSQRFSLYGDLSVDENIAFFAEIHGVRDYRARRDHLLTMTGLAAFRSRLADKLSGGMKQKLALACTLVHEPRLILLDEPTTGVDPMSRREFWKLLSEFLARGLTIVMTTPYLDEAERCDRVALLHQGRVLAVDTPASLREGLPGVAYEVVADDHRTAFEVIQRVEGVTDVQMFGERARVRFADGGPEISGRIREALEDHHVHVESVRAVATSLEDAFIARLHSVRSQGPNKARP